MSQQLASKLVVMLANLAIMQIANNK